MNDTMTDSFAVVFENFPPSGFPDHLLYKIRLSRPFVDSSRLFPEFMGGGPGISGNYEIHYMLPSHWEAAYYAQLQ
jgi:hypothetical protein